MKIGSQKYHPVATSKRSRINIGFAAVLLLPQSSVVTVFFFCYNSSISSISHAPTIVCCYNKSQNSRNSVRIFFLQVSFCHSSRHSRLRACVRVGELEGHKVKAQMTNRENHFENFTFFFFQFQLLLKIHFLEFVGDNHQEFYFLKQRGPYVLSFSLKSVQTTKK